MAAQTTSLQIRVNKKRKDRVKAMFLRQGIPLSVAVEMFFAKADEVQGMPFVVQERKEIPNAKTAKIMDRILSGKEKSRYSPTFSNTDDAVAYLRKKVL